ncbi:MAG: AAA family ATPase [Clostridia bacterium]|nr:AAA family ATPase [Clostridia bacterium]
MAKIISLINEKGGVGKTSSANAIAVCLKHKNYKVLGVDFDKQGYFSYSVGAETRESPTIYDVIKNNVNAIDAIQHTPVIDIIPTDGLLGNIEKEYFGVGSERLLKDALAPLSSMYDYIIIDSPPELGLSSANVINASNVVLIPALCDFFSLQGVIQVHETISRIKHAINPDLVLGGMFLCRYYPREELSRVTRETAVKLCENLNMTLLDTKIRHSTVITNAMTAAQDDLIEFAPKNPVVKDYISLVDELFERGIL